MTDEIQRMENNAKVEEYFDLIEWVDYNCNDQEKREWINRFEKTARKWKSDI